MKFAWALAVLILLAACQPTVLRTETRFIPPTDPEQLACIGRCEQANRDCLRQPDDEPRPISRGEGGDDQAEAERIRREYDECSKEVQSEYEQCEMRARASGGRGTCYKNVCLVKGELPARHDGENASAASPDAEACVRIHEACYRRCGGRVETFETCEGYC